MKILGLISIDIRNEGVDLFKRQSVKWDYGTYHIGDLRCSHTCSMEVDEGPDKKSDIWPHWMAVCVHLKNEFTEDKKYHNLMIWLR